MPDVQRPSLTEIATVLAEQQPATFCLYRHEDVTGASGTGVVAFGARFTDGTVVLRWCGESPSTVVWPSIEAAERVHGHAGRTEVVWLHDPATDVDSDDPLVQEIHHMFAGDMPPELVDEITRRMAEARAVQQRLSEVAEPDSNLVAHARRELELLGETDASFVESIVGAVRAFASGGHSGGSAGIAIQYLERLLRFQNLSPLTNDPTEWIDRTEISGYPCWQSLRNAEAFSKDGGKTYWLLSDPSDDKGNVEVRPSASDQPFAEYYLRGRLQETLEKWGIGNGCSALRLDDIETARLLGDLVAAIGSDQTPATPDGPGFACVACAGSDLPHACSRYRAPSSVQGDTTPAPLQPAFRHPQCPSCQLHMVHTPDLMDRYHELRKGGFVARATSAPSEGDHHA